MRQDPQSISSSRLAAEFRHCIAQDIVDYRTLTTGHALLQGRDPGAYRIERRPHRLCGNDAGNSDVGSLFSPREQDFVQPLARTNAGIGNLDITPGLKS